MIYTTILNIFTYSNYMTGLFNTYYTTLWFWRNPPVQHVLVTLSSTNISTQWVFQIMENTRTYLTNGSPGPQLWSGDLYQYGVPSTNATYSEHFLVMSLSYTRWLSNTSLNELASTWGLLWLLCSGVERKCSVTLW